jgi:surface protein
MSAFTNPSQPAKKEEEEQEKEEENEEEEEEEEGEEEEEDEEDQKRKRKSKASSSANLNRQLRKTQPENEYVQERYSQHGFSNEGLRSALNNYFHESNTWRLPDISEWDVSSVTDMSNLFSPFKTIITPDLIVDLSGWDVGNVTTMSHMFDGCQDFTSNLIDWDVGNVTTMDHMFNGCRSFSSNLSIWRVENVISMVNMFNGCIDFFCNLRYWRINPRITPPITDIESIFGSGCAMKFYPYYYPIVYTPLPPPSPSSDQLPSIEPPKSSVSYSQEEIHQQLEEFKHKYSDFSTFMDFVFAYLSKASPSEYGAYLTNITPRFFVIDCPTGYNFNKDIPEEVLRASPDPPFFAGLKYFYSKLPRFRPSTSSSNGECTEYTYAFYLNRLIYYYNLYNSSGDLQPGFNETAAVVILTHGNFIETRSKEHVIHQLPEPMKNIFVCHKSAIGCLAYDFPITRILSTFSNDSVGKMSKAITEDGSIVFDEIFPQQIISDPLPFPQCRVSRDNPFGDSMRNRIVPRIDVYLEKNFTTEGEACRIIIDIETLDEVKTHYNINETYILNAFRTKKPEEYRPYLLILYMADLMYIMPPDRVNTTNGPNRSTTMHNIVEYYASQGKKNLFVYDMSCGGVPTIRDKYGFNLLDERQTFDRRLITEELEAHNQDLALKHGLGTRRKNKRKKGRHTNRRKGKKIHQFLRTRNKRHMRSRRRSPSRKRRQH